MELVLVVSIIKMYYFKKSYEMCWFRWINGWPPPHHWADEDDPRQDLQGEACNVEETEHIFDIIQVTLCALNPATFKVIEQSMSVVPIPIIKS